jgi:hypothetical protein
MDSIEVHWYIPQLINPRLGLAFAVLLVDRLDGQSDSMLVLVRVVRERSL